MTLRYWICWTLSFGGVFNLEKGMISCCTGDMVIPQHYYILSAQYRLNSQKYFRAHVRKKVTIALSLTVIQVLLDRQNDVLMGPSVWIINIAFWVFLNYLFRSIEMISFCLITVKLPLVLVVCGEKTKPSSVTVYIDTAWATGTNAIAFCHWKHNT